MEKVSQVLSNIQKPFESVEDFKKKDLQINRMVLDVFLYSVAGLTAGAFIFRGRIPIGFCAGAAGSWKLRGYVEELE